MNLGKSRDSRFLKKILTDAEIEYVKNANHPDRALWSIWACKETAYKVMKKSFPDTAFIPRRWQTVVNINQSEYSEGEVVSWEKDGIYVRLFPSSDYVHCIGTDRPEALDKLIYDVAALPKEETNPSFFSRQCLTQSLARHFSLDFDQISIKRTRQNNELDPPLVYVSGQKMDIDISLSHDGRFISYAYNDIR